jgi:hypothetical protein
MLLLLVPLLTQTSLARIWRKLARRYLDPHLVELHVLALEVGQFLCCQVQFLLEVPSLSPDPLNLACLCVVLRL